jgi:CheY-like chemotaxis protein
MASGVAHDVNNALSPIVAYSELLLSTMPHLPDTAREYLQTIKRSGNDIAQIVARMREFYRRRSDTEHLVKSNINTIIEEVVDLTRPRWRDLSQREGISIEIKREFDPKSPLLLSDPSDLREALINLTFNAVDALPQGGTITFVTRTVLRPAPDKKSPPEQFLQLEVRDNGVGMDEKTRARCLEPFFSTKAKRGGTGLGLAMVYGMMQRHDGTIEIESALSHGTCVRLAFPVCDNNSRHHSKSKPKSSPERSLRILCIDDEPLVREVLNDCLSTFRHHVTVAASGKQGIELFHNARLKNQSYEVVVTDLGMPDMDGTQVAKSIKAVSPSTPVIMMTGWGTMMKDEGESTPEVDALIGKPPRINELNNLLLQLVANSHPQ